MAEERSLETLKQILKDKYKANDKIERLFYPDNPLPLADCYLDLALVEEKVIKKKKTASAVTDSTASSFASENAQEDLSSREYFLHEYERIENIQKKLAVKAILAECKQPKKRIYIEGAAGAGKSTLSRYIANEWANDQAPWNQYEWMFYIRLRELNIDKYSADLEELLKVVNGELFSGYGNRLMSKEIYYLKQALIKQPQKVLWILDGYDELNTTIANCFWWQDLLASNFDLLMTSRPGTQLPKSELGINLNLAVLGFNDEQVKKYICNFFNPTHTSEAQIADAEQCLALIKADFNLWSLAHTPIQLELICSIWKDLEKKQELPLTELYRMMLERLLKRRAQKEGMDIEELSNKQLKARYANYLSYMEYLAFLGMQTKKIILPEKYINVAYNSLPDDKHQQMDFYKQLKALGIVKRYNNGKQAEFVHLTFQEYFAARYIAKAIKAFSQGETYGLSHQVLLNFIGRTKWDHFYEVMWWFVAGLLGGRPHADNQGLEHYKFHQGDSNTSDELIIPKSHQRLQTLQTLFDLLLQEPRETLEAFELPLLVCCLAEARLPNILQREAIKQHFERWLEFYWIKGDYVLRTSLLKKLVQILQSHRELVEWIQDFFMRLFQSANGNVRHLAAEAVGELGASASEALQIGLLPLLQDKDMDVCFTATKVVGILGESASEILQQGLLRLLQNKESIVRSVAATTVSVLGDTANESLKQALWLLLQDVDSNVRCSAVRAVGSFGKSTGKKLQQKLILVLQDEDLSVQHEAAEAVGFFRESISEEFQQSLLSLLQHNEERVRYAAILAVHALGISSNKTLQTELLSRLQDKNENIRCITADIVGALGELASETLQQGLVPLLQDENVNVRCAAVRAISSLGTSVGQELQQQLIWMLQDKDSSVRQAAAQAVGAFGESASDALLLSLSQDVNWDVRFQAAITMRNLSVSANEMLEARLLLMLKDKKADVCYVAALLVAVLGESGGVVGEELQQKLLSLLESDNANIRSAAAQAIGHLNESMSKELQIGLISLLEDRDKEVRYRAELALDGLGKSMCAELQQKLLLQLQDKNQDKRNTAVSVVRELVASASEEVQQRLASLLQSEFADVRYAVAVAVSALGKGASEELQQGLLLLLQDQYNYVREAAVNAVDVLSDSASEELKKGLLPLLQDTDNSVRDLAYNTLAKTKSGLVLLCQEIFKNRPLSIFPSRLILSSKDVVQVNQYGQLNCLKLCGTILQNIIHNEFSHHITEDEWTLAIVRKKIETNDPSRATSYRSFFNPFKNIQSHAFLILEGVKDSVRFATKIDLLTVNRSSSQSGGQKVVIQITEIDDFARLQELADNSCSMVHGICREQAERLLQIIKQDQARAERGEIVYSLAGDGSSSSTSTVQKHSCISWCLEKWQQIGLPLKRKWYDTIVVLPSVYLAAVKHSEVKDKCLIM